ncbi:MAG: tRNA (cytidine(56)-2'-O)-methyltransferase [Candidatus Hydrothermarchaeaceae archaeon]
MKIVVLRLGHRHGRDKRITTHVGLVARAFGAEGMVMSTEDRTVEESIRRVNERWGGNFFVESVDWKEYMKSWKGIIVHLTMYGMPVDEAVKELREVKKDMLVVVGSEKVPREIYEIADYNVAISSQPHSEVSALAVFLDRLTDGKWVKKEFGGKLKIVPSRKCKKVQGY